MLRYTIRGGNFARLCDELDHVRRYLTIQKARFGERLYYEMRSDDALLELQVPKLALMSLVENSIVHGMRGDVDAIHIAIDCALEDDVCAISVRDDGAGIAADQLGELRAILVSDSVIPTQHIGLSNLASRLRLLYDGRAHVRIDSRTIPARETMIRIEIPLEVMRRVQNADH